MKRKKFRKETSIGAKRKKKSAHLSSQPSSPPHDGIPPPRHCTLVGITVRAGCGATSSAALQPKRVGSKRAAQQLGAAAAHHTTVVALRQPGGVTIGQNYSEQLRILEEKPIACIQCD